MADTPTIWLRRDLKAGVIYISDREDDPDQQDTVELPIRLREGELLAPYFNCLENVLRNAGVKIGHWK